MIAALDPANYARRFIDAGVPVVVCRPHDHHARCGTECSRELDIPAGWNTLTAHACDLSGFREGIDVLAMVSGHGIDVVDVDTKDGGSVEALPPFEHFGHHRTPSGGSHYFVKSTGFGKISPFRVNGRHVGDYAGGTPGGGGRLLVFLPGSTRARKYPDAGYHVLQPVDFERLAEAQRDDALVTVLSNVGARSTGEPGHRSAASSEVLEFLTAHSTPSDCPYGRSAVNGLIEQSRSLIPGHPTQGRHGWAVRSVSRIVELAKAGCCSATDLHALEARLQVIKPEGGTDFQALLAWALANANGSTSCAIHGVPGATGGTLGREAFEAAAAAPETPQGLEERLWSDLSFLLRGDRDDTGPTTSVGHRDDGMYLLYPAAVNTIYGDPETGKSWIALAFAAEQLAAGVPVAYIDADHNGASAIGSRLVALGAGTAVLADPDAFRHYAPEDGRMLDAIRDELLGWRPGFVVVDSVGEVIPLFGGDSNSNDDVTRANRRLNIPLKDAGWCVLQLDHLSKNGDAAWPTGGMAKKRATDGTMLHVKVRTPFAPGAVGEAYLNITKDRHGRLREVDPKSAGLFVLDSSGLTTRWEVRAPLPADGEPAEPTELMQRISEYLDLRHRAGDERVSQRDIRKNMHGRAATIGTALRLLGQQGCTAADQRGTYLLRPYTPPGAFG
jgi:hypothetical protein